MALSILFCRCGSHLVDVTGWAIKGGFQVALVHCSSCSNETEVVGLTVGRVWPDNEAEIIREARKDLALPSAFTTGVKN